MTQLKEFIKNKRPSLSGSSITTYSSILKNLYKKVFGDTDIDISKFGQTEKILDFLNDVEPNKRKSILSALVIVTDNDKYRQQMLEDVKSYNHEISKQEKTETQKENWLEQSELRTMFEKYKKDANLIYKKENKTISDLQNLQNFIILALFTLIPPRRALDYVSFKIKGNIDKTKDNYIEKGILKFNTYKTSKTYGLQEIQAPKELMTILNKWIKINPTDYLLFDMNLNQLSSVKLNQRFNKIFGKKIAINAIRHSFLTNKYSEEMKKQKQMSDDMTKMGTSMSQAETYVKLD